MCHPCGPDRMRRATDHRHNYKPVIELPLAHHPPAHEEAGSHEEAGDDLDGVARGQDRRAFVGGRHLWRQRHDYYKTEKGRRKKGGCASGMKRSECRSEKGNKN